MKRPHYISTSQIHENCDHPRIIVLDRGVYCEECEFVIAHCRHKLDAIKQISFPPEYQCQDCLWGFVCDNLPDHKEGFFRN